MYDYDNAPERDLIRRARRGDAKAFARLYSEIYRDLYRFALCMLRHPQEAEDAVSEAVIAAYENISSLRKESSFKSWIFTILNNECRRALMKRGRERKITDDADTYPGTAAAGAEPDYAQREDIRRALELLDEEERMIVAFSVFGGYRSEEIAEMLNKNASSVRSRKRRALEKMRVSLGSAV